MFSLLIVIVEHAVALPNAVDCFFPLAINNSYVLLHLQVLASRMLRTSQKFHLSHQRLVNGKMLKISISLIMSSPNPPISSLEFSVAESKADDLYIHSFLKYDPPSCEYSTFAKLSVGSEINSFTP